jgi:hypothetical protein
VTDLSIVGQILLRLQGKGGLDAAKQLDQSTTAAKKTQKSFVDLNKTSSDLGKTLTRFLGGAALVAFAKSSLTEFAKLERSLNAIRFVMGRLGLDAEQELPKVQKVLESLEKSGGPLLSETIPAFQKFISITKSVPAALEAVRLASDISESGLFDVGTAADAVASIMQGKAALAAKTLNVEINKQNGTVKTNAELLAEVRDIYGGLGSKISDTTDEIDKSTAAFKDLQREVGKGIASIIELIGGADKVVASIKVVSLGIVGGVFVAIRALAELGNVAKSAFDFRAAAAGPTAYAANVITAVKSGSERLKTLTTDIMAENSRIWEEAGKDAGTSFSDAEAKAREDAFKALQDQAARKQDEGVTEEAKKKAEEALKIEKDRLDKVRQLERESSLELQREKIASLQEDSQERLNAEIELLDQVRKIAIEDAEAVNASKKTIDDVFLLAQDNLRREYADRNKKRQADDAREIAEETLRIVQETQEVEADLAELDREERLANSKLTLQEREDIEIEFINRKRDAQLRAIEEEEAAELEKQRVITEANIEAETDPEKKIELQAALSALEIKIAERTAKRRLAIEKGAAIAIRNIDKMTAQQRIETGLTVAQAAVNLITTLFGKSKLAAAAQAAIDTWGAVNRTLNSLPFPANVVAAGLVAAQGLANVLKIKNTSIGGGGSGSSSSAGSISTGSSRATASVSGSVSTDPIVGRTRDSGRGGTFTPPTSTTIDQSTHVYGNVYGGKFGIAALKRELDRAAYRDRSRLAR